MLSAAPGQFGAVPLCSTLPRVLPLPKGEGRGEGEWGNAIPATQPLLAAKTGSVRRRIEARNSQ
jgi:hypothetical protein